ncbi:hypothetical protein FPV67DRAFT_1467005 [Lyophyllum atratum]|nr:hypothetical protein FPV67DRAFT_1467005 [Lyophyllum atratum]
MSTWNLGINDVTEQEQAFKDKLSSKDGHIAALQTQLMKQAQEMQELQGTYNEKLRKLADETNHTLQLEAELNACSESLRNEKIGSQNLTQTLAAARETVKQKDLDARDLHANLESLSHLSDGYKSRADKLAQEKATLEARVRELQAIHRQAGAPPTTPGHRRTATRSRSRSSSPSRARINILEQELVQMRSSLSQKENDILLANEKVSHAHEELIRTGNEKTALEKRTSRQLAEAQASVEEKEEELRNMQGMLGNHSRERELEQRIEEDEAKILALEQSSRADQAKHSQEEKEWKKQEKELKSELKVLKSELQRERVSESEREIELIKEKEEALDQRDDARAKLTTLEESLRIREAQIHQGNLEESTTAVTLHEDAMDVDDATAANVEKLLRAIDRLRAERNDLQTRFEVEALKAKLAGQSAKTIEELRTELAALSAQAAALLKDQESRTCAVEDLSDPCSSCDHIHGQLLQDKLKDTEVKLEVTRDDLDTEFEQALAGDYFKQQLDVLANLQNELSVVQRNLRDAEGRYSDLQFHQLDAMSKTEATRMLQKELTEERARVGRRDDHIAMLQHDIQRLETNLRLQEERLGEMTMELEMMGAAKDAMVDDCADAREARDGALAKLEMLEMEMETRLEEGDQAVEALVRVVVETVGGARDSVRIQCERTRLAKEALTGLEGEHSKALRALEEREVLLRSRGTIGDEFRQSTVALAVARVGLGKAMSHLQEITEDKEILEREIQSQQDDLDHSLADRKALATQLETVQHQAADAALDFANRTATLEQQIQDLRNTISDIEETHHIAIEELVQSKERLATTLNQAQQSLVESDSSDGLARLRQQHTLELSEAQARLSESQGRWRTCDYLTRQPSKSLRNLQGICSRLLSYNKQQRKAGRRSRRRPRAFGRTWIMPCRSNRRSKLPVTSCKRHLIASRKSSRRFRINRRASSSMLSSNTPQFKGGLRANLPELQAKLDVQSRELDAAVDSRKADKTIHEKELNRLELQRKNAESVVVELQLESLQDEKSSLQQEITTLEAEIQRSISLGRFQESQLKESEAKITSLTEELEQIQASLAHSEKAAKAAEVHLSLQGAQHKREMADLNRQLGALRSQPNLQKAVSELEERNNEMEELLRNKCAEIEENDDRALEMLKENKKLTTKVESLTRKVQNLQTKLAAAKASMSSPSNPIPAVQSSSAASASSSGSKNVISRSRSNTLTNAPSAPTIPPVPPLPKYVTSLSTNAPSPASRTPLHRAVSGPSSLSRPKTPERRVAQPPPVFKARTPERRTISSPLEALSSSTIIACETLAPQGFTVDSLPSREVGEDNSTTPRVRRVLSGFQSGFTPVRNQARPMIPIPSPKRLMMSASVRSSPVIADVTNSPRGRSAKGKGGWLGKIRNTSSQTTSRPGDSRPRFERDTS